MPDDLNLTNNNSQASGSPSGLDGLSSTPGKSPLEEASQDMPEVKPETPAELAPEPPQADVPAPEMPAPDAGMPEEPTPDEEEPKDKEDTPPAPPQLTVNFNPSNVKRYNDVKFVGSQATVDKITKDGIEGTVMGVHVFINFNDIVDEN